MSSKIEEVIANWLREATSPVGTLSAGTTLEEWVAKRFVEWLQAETSEHVESAQAAVDGVREELNRLGGFDNKELGEALHELTHIEESLADLRSVLELKAESQ